MAGNEATTLFLNFQNFFSIFLEFSIMRRVGLKRNDNCCSFFLRLFQPILALNQDKTEFFNFLKFFPIFLKFSITRQVGTEQNDSFYFVHFLAVPPLFWL